MVAKVPLHVVGTKVAALLGVTGTNPKYMWNDRSLPCQMWPCQTGHANEGNWMLPKIMYSQIATKRCKPLSHIDHFSYDVAVIVLLTTLMWMSV